MSDEAVAFVFMAKRGVPRPRLLTDVRVLALPKQQVVALDPSWLRPSKKHEAEVVNGRLGAGLAEAAGCETESVDEHAVCRLAVAEAGSCFCS